MNEILVVEDDQRVLEMTGEALKSYGYKVMLLQDPYPVLNLLKADPNRFDLLLFDWKLRSALDGDKLLGLLQILPNFKAPTIFVTGYTHIASKHLMRLGAYDTLRKPVTAEQLIDCVERALNKKPPEDPHLQAPNELNSTALKKRELTERILGALAEHQWNVTKAAKSLGCSRRTLHRWIEKAGLHQYLSKTAATNFAKSNN